MPKVEYMNPTDIRPASHQPRSEVGNISELTAEIRERGFASFLAAVENEDGSREVLFGSLRHSAAIAAGEQHVPVFVYRREELDPQAAWGMQLGENLHRRNPPPADDGRAFMEMRLRMDCTSLWDALDEEYRWLDSYSAWEAEAARLQALADKRGMQVPLTTWDEVRDYLHIPERYFKDALRLGRLEDEVRSALNRSRLNTQQQLAVADAPAPRQLELTRALGELDEAPQALVIAAAARALAELIAVSAGAVLAVTAHLREERRTNSAKELAALVVAELGGIPEEEDAATQDQTQYQLVSTAQPDNDGSDNGDEERHAPTARANTAPLSSQMVMTEEDDETVEGEEIGQAGMSAPVAQSTLSMDAVTIPTEGWSAEAQVKAKQVVASIDEQMMLYTQRGDYAAAQQFLDAVTGGLDDAYLALSRARGKR